MTTFDDRERAFEAKFAHDEEAAFKAQAKRDRLLAEWAGTRMGLVDRALGDYVTEVWREDLKQPGDEDVFRKVAADLEAKGVAVPEADLRAKMAELLDQARAEVAAQG
jgi:hypothetical protein